MNVAQRRVTDASSFREAVEQKNGDIEIVGVITDLQSVTLAPGTRLRGADAGAELHFKEAQPGLLLSANHEISALRLVTDDTQIALGLADEVDDLGTIVVSDVTTVGRVHLEGSKARSGHIALTNVHVERADARMAGNRPAGFGVEVLLGAITVYNASKDEASRWILEADNLSGGTNEQPLRGSGVFVFGGWFIPIDADMTKAPAPTQEGGTIELRRLTTGDLYSDGGIPKGMSTLIAGGVFVGSGVDAQEVINEGTTTTYGPNDMVLDNWGKVDSWVSKRLVKSFGPSGIGFVNFGQLNTLKVDAPIETRGIGARGFNLYDGSLDHADLESITTYGDGAIGIQLSKPFGRIRIGHDVRTKGGEGDSLVKGKVTHLKAHAISLKQGTRGDEISVGGEVVAENQSIPSWDFDAPASSVDRIEVGGRPFDAATVEGGSP